LPLVLVAPLSVGEFKLQENVVELSPAASTVKVCPSRVVPVPETATLVPALKLFAAAKVTRLAPADSEVMVATELHVAPHAAKGAGMSVTKVSGELVPVEMLSVFVTTSAIVPASQILT
jgi:hypothetical protein